MVGYSNLTKKKGILWNSFGFLFLKFKDIKPKLRPIDQVDNKNKLPSESSSFSFTKFNTKYLGGGISL